MQYVFDNKISGLKLEETAKDSIVLLKNNKRVISQLRNNAYLTAAIDSINRKKQNYIVYISTGKIYNWSNLSKGNVSDDALSSVNYREKIYFSKPLKKNETSTLLNGILKFYENNGYPFAQVGLSNVLIQKNLINAEINVTKGKLYLIDSLIIKGDANIGSSYLYNYLGIKPGDPYNEKLINQIGDRLKEIPFIQQSQSYEVRFFEEECKVLLYLKKKSASRFDGILGLLTNEVSGKVEFTGNVELNLKNAIGKGESIDLEWRKLIGASQNLNLHLNYPFLFNLPFGVDGTFKLYKRDTLFLDVTSKAGIQYILGGYDFLQIYLQNNSSRRLSNQNTVYTPSSSLPPYSDYKSIQYGVGYNMERLNYRYNPIKGFQFTVDASTGNKNIKPIKKLEENNPSIYNGVKLNSTIFQGQFKGSLYLPLFKRFTIKLANQSAVIFNENLFDNELFRIGGIKTLRGFDEESIFASKYTIGTAEFRFIVDKNSNLFIFSDIAYYEKDTQTDKISDNPMGFGAGMNFETAAGIFSINYAVGSQFNNPIDFRASKIHFGFVNFF